MVKFKIIEIKIAGDNLQVAISHDTCEREVFGLPLDLAEDNKYINEIRRILGERNKINKKIKIDKAIIGKEIDV